MRYQNSLHQRRLAERSLKHLTDFLDLSDELVLGKGIEALINRIVQMASKVMKADRASLFLVDPATGDLWSRVAEGEDTKMITIPAGTGIAGWVAQHDSILNIREAYNDERFNPAVDRPHSKSLSSVRFKVLRHGRTSLWLAGFGFQAAGAADEQVLSGHRRGLLHNTHICRCLEAYSSRGAFFSELQSGQIQAACSSSSRRRFFISMMRQKL